MKLLCGVLQQKLPYYVCHLKSSNSFTVGVKLFPPPWFQGAFLKTSPSVRNSLSWKNFLGQVKPPGGGKKFDTHGNVLIAFFRLAKNKCMFLELFKLAKIQIQVFWKLLEAYKKVQFTFFGELLEAYKKLNLWFLAFLLAKN